MIQGLRITFCTYFKCINKFRFESETYDEYTVFCLKSGSFSYKIGSEPEKILSEGEMVICPPNQPFFRKIIKSAQLLMIKFVASEDILFVSDSIKHLDLMRLDYNLKRLENCLFCTDMERNPHYAHYCTDIIYMAGDAIVKNTDFSDIINYMQSKFNENIQVSALAKRTGYSTAQFIYIFKKYYGCTPKQYISKIIINKSKELLIMTDKTSREIAFICGFNDELYFIRFFKKHTGLTPTNFRKCKKQFSP